MAKIYAGDVITGSTLTSNYESTFAVPATPVQALLFLNDCDQALMVKVGDEELRIPASLSLRLGDLSAGFSFQPAVSAKHDGTAPSSGKLQVVGIGK